MFSDIGQRQHKITYMVRGDGQMVEETLALFVARRKHYRFGIKHFVIDIKLTSTLNLEQ